MNRIVKKIGCHKQCPKWGLYQGDHQGKAIGLLHEEGDQNQAGEIVVTPNGGIYGNSTPQN
jgi:hypothetical protein